MNIRHSIESINTKSGTIPLYRVITYKGRKIIDKSEYFINKNKTTRHIIKLIKRSNKNQLIIHEY